MLGFTSLRRRTEALLPDFEEVKRSCHVVVMLCSTWE